MDLSTVLSFLGVAMLLTLAPGPDILFVIAQSVSYGKKEGVVTALGLCSGVTVHTLAAALGISAIFYQSDLAFQVIKYAGAIYLLYLAWQSFREGSQAITVGKVAKQSLPSLYRKGIFMNVLNPKVSLFFLALLPQFVSNKGMDIPMQMMILGLVFMLQAVIIFSIIALFAGTFGQKLVNNPKVARVINIVKASFFSIIGVRLILIEK